MTPSQLQTLKAAIAAETNQTFVDLRTAADETGMAAWYNADAAFQVWKSSTDAASLFNAITWKSLTPADAADGTALFTNRALVCQAKQINLQIILQGQTSIATGKVSLRQGLTDALLDVPAGASGALLDAGWLGAGKVKATIQRSCNRVERIWATGTGTANTPGDLGEFEGTVTVQNISDALRA